MNSTPTLKYAISQLTLESVSKDKFFTEHQHLADAKQGGLYLYYQVVAYLHRHPTRRFDHIDHVPSRNTYHVTFTEVQNARSLHSYYYGERSFPIHPLDVSKDPPDFSSISGPQVIDSVHAFKALKVHDIFECSYLLYKLIRTDLPVTGSFPVRYCDFTLHYSEFDPTAILRNFNITDFACLNDFIYDNVYDNFIQRFPSVLDVELLFAPEVILTITADLEVGKKQSCFTTRFLSMMYQLAYSASLFYKALVFTKGDDIPWKATIDILISYLEDCLIDTISKNETPFHEKILSLEIQLSDLFIRNQEGTLSTTRLTSYVFSLPMNAPPTRHILRKILVISSLFVYLQACYLPSNTSSLFEEDDD